MKRKKSQIITNILIVVLVILLSFFILNGSQLYTISNRNVLEENIETIKDNEPAAENIEFLGKDKFNYSCVYLYKVDNKYSIFTYEKSIFSSRLKLSSYRYKISSLDNLKLVAENQVYDNKFTITNENNKPIIKNEPTRNKTILVNIINIIVVLLICFVGTLFVIKKKFKHNED